MDIPLHIVEAGLTEEYVETHKLIDQIEQKQTDLYGRGSNLATKVKYLWVQEAGRNFSVKNPTRMEWRDMVAVHDLTKEMLEVSGLYYESKREMNEASRILRQLHELAKKKKEES
jgi:hypothetical protein